MHWLQNRGYNWGRKFGSKWPYSSKVPNVHDDVSMPKSHYGHCGVYGNTVQLLLLGQDVPTHLLQHQDSAEPGQLTFDHRRPGLVNSQDRHEFGPDFPYRRRVVHVLITTQSSDVDQQQVKHAVCWVVRRQCVTRCQGGDCNPR